MKIRQLAGLIGVSLLSVPLYAQQITGKVVLSDGNTPSVHTLVVARDATGRTVARALTSEQGSYTLHLGGPGNYSVAVLRAGFAPVAGSPLQLTDTSTRKQDITLADIPIRLDPTVTLGRKDCALPKDDGRAFVNLWSRGITSMTAAQLADETLQLVAFSIDGESSPGRRNSVEYWREAEEVVGPRVLGTTPAEVLETNGYVRELPDGAVIYDVPNPEALMSDSFLDNRCVKVIRQRDHAGLVGISFSDRKQALPDISGVVWFDSTSSELRRLEFVYTGLKALSIVCGQPVGSRPAPCANGNSSEAGGWVAFGRLDSGEFFVREWEIRTLATKAEWKQRRPSQPLPKGALPGARLNIPEVRYATSRGAVARAFRNGNLVFASDAAEQQIKAAALIRAGSHPGSLEGLVLDQLGIPVASAIIDVSDPRRSTVTNSKGEFRLEWLPTEELSILVRHEHFRAASLKLRILADSTRRIRISLPQRER